MVTKDLRRPHVDAKGIFVVVVRCVVTCVVFARCSCSLFVGKTCCFFLLFFDLFCLLVCLLLMSLIGLKKPSCASRAGYLAADLATDFVTSRELEAVDLVLGGIMGVSLVVVEEEEALLLVRYLCAVVTEGSVVTWRLVLLLKALTSLRHLTLSFASLHSSPHVSVSSRSINNCMSCYLYVYIFCCGSTILFSCRTTFKYVFA